MLRLKCLRGVDLLHPSVNPAADLRSIIRNILEEMIPNVIANRYRIDTNTFVF